MSTIFLHKALQLIEEAHSILLVDSDGDEREAYAMNRCEDERCLTLEDHLGFELHRCLACDNDLVHIDEDQMFFTDDSGARISLKLLTPMDLEAVR